MDAVFHDPSPAPRFLPSVRALALLTLGVGIGVMATLPFTGDGSGLAVLAIGAATASAALAALKPKNPLALGAALVMLGLAVIATVFGRLGILYLPLLAAFLAVTARLERTPMQSGPELRWEPAPEFGRSLPPAVEAPLPPPPPPGSIPEVAIEPAAPARPPPATPPLNKGLPLRATPQPPKPKTRREPVPPPEPEVGSFRRVNAPAPERLTVPAMPAMPSIERVVMSDAEPVIESPVAPVVQTAAAPEPVIEPAAEPIPRSALKLTLERAVEPTAQTAPEPPPGPPPEPRGPSRTRRLAGAAALAGKQVGKQVGERAKVGLGNLREAIVAEPLDVEPPDPKEPDVWAGLADQIAATANPKPKLRKPRAPGRHEARPEAAAEIKPEVVREVTGEPQPSYGEFPVPPIVTVRPDSDLVVIDDAAWDTMPWRPLAKR